MEKWDNVSETQRAPEVKKARASLNSASKSLSFNHLLQAPDKEYITFYC